MNALEHLLAKKKHHRLWLLGHRLRIVEMNCAKRDSEDEGL
jgi:hypothetical protein